MAKGLTNRLVPVRVVPMPIRCPNNTGTNLFDWTLKQLIKD